MQKVFVVTDSTADLPMQLAQEKDITIVPFTTVMDGKVYQEGKDISVEDFYVKMANCKDVPKTSQPTPGDYASIFEKVKQEHPGAQILHVAFASALSGACQSAKTVAEMSPELGVTVYDTKAPSIGQGWIALKAAELAAQGAGKEEIVQALDKVREKLYIFFSVDNLEYLKKGGRLSAVKTIIGTMMNIKPILLCNEEGKLIAFDKARGRKQALRRLAELVGENVKDFSRLHLGIAAGGCKGDQMELKKMLELQYGIKDFLLSQIGIVIGSHVGPGVINVIFYEE